MLVAEGNSKATDAATTIDWKAFSGRIVLTGGFLFVEASAFALLQSAFLYFLTASGRLAPARLIGKIFEKLFGEREYYLGKDSKQCSYGRICRVGTASSNPVNLIACDEWLHPRDPRACKNSGIDVYPAPGITETFTFALPDAAPEKTLKYEFPSDDFDAAAALIGGGLRSQSPPLTYLPRYKLVQILGTILCQARPLLRANGRTKDIAGYVITGRGGSLSEEESAALVKEHGNHLLISSDGRLRLLMRTDSPANGTGEERVRVMDLWLLSKTPLPEIPLYSEEVKARQEEIGTKLGFDSLQRADTRTRFNTWLSCGLGDEQFSSPRSRFWYTPLGIFLPLSAVGSAVTGFAQFLGCERLEAERRIQSLTDGNEYYLERLGKVEQLGYILANVENSMSWLDRRLSGETLKSAFHLLWPEDPRIAELPTLRIFPGARPEWDDYLCAALVRRNQLFNVSVHALNRFVERYPIGRAGMHIFSWTHGLREMHDLFQHAQPVTRRHRPNTLGRNLLTATEHYSAAGMIFVVVPCGESEKLIKTCYEE